VILLFAAPLLAWSRFTIPAGKIPAEQLGNLRVQLQAHVFADGTKLGLADHLFSPDQLPQGYCETLQLAQRLGTAALHDKDHRIDPGQLPETMNFLSDTPLRARGSVRTGRISFVQMAGRRTESRRST
jgi:hypothetical protein